MHFLGHGDGASKEWQGEMHNVGCIPKRLETENRKLESENWRLNPSLAIFKIVYSARLSPLLAAFLCRLWFWPSLN